MKDKQLPLVTYDQARRLKKAGFNFECLNYYHVDSDGTAILDDDADPYEYNWNSSDSADIGERLFDDSSFKNYDQNYDCEICSAPTVALALKWMRDVKGIVGNVICRYEKRDEVYINEVFVGDGWNESQDFDTYEAAESALLDELLIKLISLLSH